MDAAFPSLLLLLSSLFPVQAGTKEFHYDDFGPQAAVHELLGFGWFQWNPHGNDDPRTEPRIKVIVYWNEDLNDVQAAYPVDQTKLQDFRYLELGLAITHLEKLIPELATMNLDTGELQATLRALKTIRSSEQGATENSREN